MMRLLPLISLIACSSDLPVPAYRYGVLLADLQFEVTDPDMGIHPNVSILADPENPFAEGGISLEGKFSAYSDSPTAGFYGMGTALANQPTGEHQYYTAASLEGIYDERLEEGAHPVGVRHPCGLHHRVRGLAPEHPVRPGSFPA